MMQKKLCLLIFSVLLLGFLLGCVQQPKKAIVKDLMIEELKGSKHAVSFSILNKNWKTSDCQVRIILANDTYGIYDLGIMKPDEKKSFKTTLNFKNGETRIEVTADCKPITKKEIDACNDKKRGERMLCMLTLDKPELQQCLLPENDAPYHKLFCIALVSKDPEICLYIVPYSQKVWCKAYVTKNADLCSKIGIIENKDWCYTDIGMNFKDENICDKISDEKLKTSCIAAATLNAGLCLKGAENHKVSCIVNIIESTSNKELCDILSNEQREECLEQVR